MTDSRVLRIKTPEDCEQFAKNVEGTHLKLAKQARRRAVELRAANYGASSDAELEALQVVYAIEEIRSKLTGKKARATQTWQSIQRNGILPTVEKVVVRKTITEDYEALVEAGMEDFTFERVVQRHHALFSAEAVAQAEARLRERAA